MLLLAIWFVLKEFHALFLENNQPPFFCSKFTRGLRGRLLGGGGGKPALRLLSCM